MKQLKQQVKQETNADTKQDTKQDTRQDTRQETKQETIKQSVFHKLTDKISGYLTGEMKALKPFRQTIDEINVRRERLKTYNDDVLQLLSADLRKKLWVVFHPGNYWLTVSHWPAKRAAVYLV